MIDLILNDAKRTIGRIDFSLLKNKRILLTGCTGLIGLHLVSVLSLLKEKYNLSIFCLINNDIDDIVKPLFKDCFVYKGDLITTNNINFLLDHFSEQLNGVDYIIHAAGYAQPKKFTSNKLSTLLLNTQVISDLFKLLNPKGTFLFCSTSEVYSGIEKENITEDSIGVTSPEHPRACYIESKRCGEAFMHSFKELGYNSKIARISLAYGPGIKLYDERVLSNFIEKGLKKGYIDLLDSGSAIRTYGYVSDITEMMWNILLFGKHTTYNVAGISKTSILDLAKAVGDKLNREVVLLDNVNFSFDGNPKIVNLSLDKYLSEFNKPDFVSLDEGINNTITWQKLLYKVT